MSCQTGLQTVGSHESYPLNREGFFCNLPDATVKAFDAVGFTTGYPKGAVLFVEEDAARGVFVLCKGRVKLSMTSSEGKTVILRIVQPGELLGLHGVVSGQAYQATAETLEPCQVNFIRREDFLKLLSQNPHLSIRVAQQLSENYHAACDQIRSLGLTHSASEKLARFLLDRVTSGQTDQGLRLRLTMTHEEIGQVIGTARETVTRTFAEFRHKQLVAIKGSLLMIPNKAALERMANA